MEDVLTTLTAALQGDDPERALRARQVLHLLDGTHGDEHRDNALCYVDGEELQPPAETRDNQLYWIVVRDRFDRELDRLPFSTLAAARAFAVKVADELECFESYWIHFRRLVIGDRQVIFDLEGAA